jgi:hypothetical protein
VQLLNVSATSRGTSTRRLSLRFEALLASISGSHVHAHNRTYVLPSLGEILRCRELGSTLGKGQGWGWLRERVVRSGCLLLVLHGYGCDKSARGPARHRLQRCTAGTAYSEQHRPARPGNKSPRSLMNAQPSCGPQVVASVGGPRDNEYMEVTARLIENIPHGSLRVLRSEFARSRPLRLYSHPR